MIGQESEKPPETPCHIQPQCTWTMSTRTEALVESLRRSLTEPHSVTICMHPVKVCLLKARDIYSVERLLRLRVHLGIIGRADFTGDTTDIAYWI